MNNISSTNVVAQIVGRSPRAGCAGGRNAFLRSPCAHSNAAQPLRPNWPWLARRARTGLICALALAACGQPLRSAPATYGTGDVTIQLQAGRNLVCIPVTPRQTNPADLFAPLGANLLGAYTYVRTDTNETWLSYSPLHPAFLNTLQEIQAGQALVIDVSSDATLVVAGEPIESMRIELKSGWNLIGYNGYADHSAVEVFHYATNGLGGNSIELVWTLAANGQWSTYAPTDPNLILEPGKAYWLYLESLVSSVIFLLTDGLNYLVENCCADLQVGGIWVSTNGCNSGEAAPLEFQPVTICAVVTNAAAMPSQAGQASFYAANPNSGGFQKLGSVNYSVIGGHTSEVVSLYCDAGLAYQTILKVVADDYPTRLGTTFELKELNNRRIVPVHIRMPDLALAASELEIVPHFPHNQSAVTFTNIVVTNLGDADATNPVLRLEYTWLNPTSGVWEVKMWGEATLPSLSPGAILQANSVPGCHPTIYWYGCPTGLYRFKAIIDPHDAIHEIDDARNNVQSRLVNVPTPPDLNFQEFFFSGWHSPKGPKAGENVRVDVTIYNSGGQTATNVTATFDALNQSDEVWCPDPNDSSTWANVTLIPDIEPNCVAGTYNWFMSVPQGNNDVQVVMDYRDLNGQLTNSVTNARPFTARGLLPDLTPAAIETASWIVSDTDHPQFTVRVRNIGETDTSHDFIVSLWHTADNPPWTYTNLTCIGAVLVSGGLGVYDGTPATEKQVTITCTSGLPPGWRHIVAWVDPANEVEETYDRNDQRWQRMFVRDTRPDLRPTQLQAVPLNPLATQQASLRCVVVNDGNTSATFTTAFYSNNVLVGVGSLKTLAPGASTSVSVPVVFPEEGVYTLKAVADYGDVVSESNEDNNEIQASVHVQPQPFAIANICSNYWVDNTDMKYDYACSDVPGELKGRAWCMAESEADCQWDLCPGFGGLMFHCWALCDYQDRATLRMAVYRTFRVTGPDNGATTADVSLDLRALGLLDRFCPIGGSAYWKVKVVAGVTQGNMDSDQTAKLNAPMKQVVVMDDDSGSLWEEGLLETVKELDVQGLEVIAGEVAMPLITAIDFMVADAAVVAAGRATLTNVTLATGQEYTAFVYVDLLTTAVGLKAFSYGDFYYHQPLNDPMGATFFKTRGIWLDDVTVKFD